MKQMIFWGTLLCGLCVLFSLKAQTEQAAKKPNVVLILVDDSGLTDFGAFGGEARTPNIDKLAKEGMMFTNLHASPICAPSRAMLMTGTHSHLAGVANLPEMMPKGYDDVPGYEGVLNDSVQTIATRLKEANYNTYVTGKWHLGHDAHTLPVYRGFDRSFILGASGASNDEARGYLPMKPTATWYANGQPVDLPEDFYSSKTYVDEMIRFHKEEENPEAPFFAYMAFQAIHAPIQAPEEFVKHYEGVYSQGWDVLRKQRFEKAKGLGIVPQHTEMNPVPEQFEAWDNLSANKQQQYATDMAVMAGMLEAMDYHIGRYVEFLEAEGLAENTVFIITSDNGPDGGSYHTPMLMGWAKRHGYHRDVQKNGYRDYYGALGPSFALAVAAPFSFFKYYTGEGGLRVPLIINGPNMPAQQKRNALCMITDIAPTIYELAGVPIVSPTGYAPVVGKSLLPHIQNPDVPVYGPQEGVAMEAGNSAAYFMGNYKIVRNNITLGDGQWYMYNLAQDPGETKDIKAEHPATFQQMLSGYEAYAKAVGVVEMPDGYSCAGEVGKKSLRKMLWPFGK